MKTIIKLLVVLIAFSANAQKYRNFNTFKTKKENKKEKLALVIANAAYTHGRLDKPIDEAENIVTALEKRGFDIELGYNLDKNSMLETIISFSKKLKDYKSCLIYYGGHGFQINGKNYLVPLDTPQTDNLLELETAIVELSLVFKAINDPKKPKVIILDACRNNPFKKLIPANERGLDDDGFSKIEGQRNSLVIFSTGPGTKVRDDNQFTKVFSDCLANGGKDRAEYCIEDIIRDTSNKVEQINPRQLVWSEGNLLSEICFKNEIKKEKREDKKEDNLEVDLDGASEAMDWIIGKIAEIKLDKYISGSMLSKGYTRSYDYEMSYNKESCMVTLKEEYAYIEDRNSARNDSRYNYVYTFNLKDLKSIELVENSPFYGTKSFKITTYNSLKKIKKNENQMLNELTIKYTTLGSLADQPERFIKAFTDAITKCGGSKEEKY